MTMTLGKSRLQATVPTSLSSKSLNAPLDSDLHLGFGSRKSIRRRIRNPATVKRIGNPVGKRSRPQIPLLKWQAEDRGDGDEEEDNEEGEKFENSKETLPQEHCRRSSGEGRKGREAVVSARKLGAELWRLQFPKVVAVGESCDLPRRESHLGFQHDHVEDPILCRCNSKVYCSNKNGHLQSLYAKSGAKNGFLCKHGPTQFLNSMNEGATKWEPVSSKRTVEECNICSQMKLLDQRVSTVQAISGLESELDLARLRIQELESEHQISKKKLEQLLRKISEEKALWRTREHEKIRAFIDDVKAELNQERKNRQRVEMVNSKLVNDLADAKLSGKRFKQEYEKERKARKLIEEVCEELAKEIEENKVEVEELERESIKLREEVDEERKMLQMAEVWREERVQMKLIDAKIALDEKFSQMSKLVVDLEIFLRSRSSTLDVKEMKEGLQLGEAAAAAAVDIRDIKEFSYEPPNPDDIFSIFKDLNFGDSYGMKTEPCSEYSPASHASKIRTGSSNVDMNTKDGIPKCQNKFVGPNDDIDDGESGWETVSQLEDQDSSNSPDGSRSSINKNHRRVKYSLRSTEWEENQGGETPISEVCSVQTKQFKRSSSMARLWKSCPKNSESYKIMSMEESNGRFSNRDQGSDRSGLSPQSSSPDLDNAYLTRRKTGSITRSVQKDSLKAKLLEARMESQKVQLRQVLNHKM